MGSAGQACSRPKGVRQLTTSRMYTMSSSNRPSPTPGTLTGLYVRLELELKSTLPANIWPWATKLLELMSSVQGVYSSVVSPPSILVLDLNVMFWLQDGGELPIPNIRWRV